MNYASALPMAFGLAGKAPFSALAGAGGMKLGDLIGQSKAAQVTRLGDLNPSPSGYGTGIDSSYGKPVASSLPRTLGGLSPEGGSLLDRLPPLDMKLGDVAPLDVEGLHKKGPKFFSKDGAFWPLLGIAGDALLAYSNRPQVYAPAMAKQAEIEQERNLFVEKFQAEQAAKREERMRPKMEQVGGTLGMFDPSVQVFKPIWSEPEPFEAYASALGYEPGTADYQDAVRNYRLGSWSDDALDAKRSLEGEKLSGRKALQDDRLEVTKRGQDLRARTARRGQDMTDARGRRGQDISAAPKAVRVKTPAEAYALKPGTVFVTPDGRTKVR